MNVPKSCLKNVVKFQTIQKWNCGYLKTDMRIITKNIFLNISKRLKNKHFVLNFYAKRLLSRHRNFSGFLERFKLASWSLCFCSLGVPQIFFHLLFDCPFLNKAWNLLKRRLKPSYKLASEMSGIYFSAICLHGF